MNLSIENIRHAASKLLIQKNQSQWRDIAFFTLAQPNARLLTEMQHEILDKEEANARNNLLSRNMPVWHSWWMWLYTAGQVLGFLCSRCSGGIFSALQHLSHWWPAILLPDPGVDECGLYLGTAQSTVLKKLSPVIATMHREDIYIFYEMRIDLKKSLFSLG